MVSNYLDGLDYNLQLVNLIGGQNLHVGSIGIRLPLALRADVLIYELGLALQDSDAASVEPVLALVAAYIELRLIVRLATAAVELLRLPRLLAINANEFREFFGGLLANIYTIAVEPVAAQVAAHIKPKSGVSNMNL